MNTLWPAAFRISCLYPRSTSSCHNASRFLTRLTQRSLCLYSVSSTPIRQRLIPAFNLRPVGGKRQSCTSYTILNVTRTYASSRRIITKYEQLPKDYSDAKGLPFAPRELTDDEAKLIFGNGIDAHTVNQLLSILHGRRVAGTLPDPETEGHATTQEKEVYAIALAWLRARIPVDEDRCAVLRAEQELRDIENEIVADSQRIGIWQPNANTSQDVYGNSELDAIRVANEKLLDEKEKKRELSQADEIRLNTGTLQTFDPKSRVQLRRPGEHPRLKTYLARAQIEPDFSPETTPFKRLWPSALVTLLVLGLSWTFATFYTPPKTSTRLYPDLPPAAATVFTIMLANTLVLAAWRIPAAFRILNLYFMTLPAKPNPLSLIGNTFSHQSLYHLFTNMVVLFFVGTRLHDEVGRGNFIAIYLTCGVVGSFVSLSSFVLRNNLVSSSLGASGALCGVIASYLWLNWNKGIRIFGVFPPEDWPEFPSWLVLILLMSSDIFSVTKWNKSHLRFDHWAHLGGYAAGIASAEIVRKRVYHRKRLEKERKEKQMGLVDRVRQGRL